MAVLILGMVSLFSLTRGEAIPHRTQLDAFPIQIGAWRGERESLPPAVIDVLKATDYLMRLYQTPVRPPIWLFVAFYQSQRQCQAIHSPRNCLPGSGWNILSNQRLTVRLLDQAER